MLDKKTNEKTKELNLPVVWWYILIILIWVNIENINAVIYNFWNETLQSDSILLYQDRVLQTLQRTSQSIWIDKMRRWGLYLRGLVPGLWNLPCASKEYTQAFQRCDQAVSRCTERKVLESKNLSRLRLHSSYDVSNARISHKTYDGKHTLSFQGRSKYHAWARNMYDQVILRGLWDYSMYQLSGYNTYIAPA